MSDLEGALKLIRERAEHDPELAAALRTLLGGLLSELPSLPVEADAARSEAVDEEATVAEPGPPASAVEASDTPATPLEPTFIEWPDLRAVGVHLELKVRACCWVAEHGYTEDPAALAERYALLDEARAAGCFLWMFDLGRVNPNDAVALAELADLFDLTMRTFAFWQGAGGSPEEGDADRLLAEAQAALRVAAHTVGGYRDPDQYALFQALRLSAQASGSYLPPLGLAHTPLPLETLRARLGALEEARAAREVHAERVKRTRNKARYHVQLVAQNPADLAQWRKVEEVLGELRELGEDADDLLGPLRGCEPPPELPALQAVLRAVPVTLPRVPEEARPSVPEVQSEQVRRVRALLEGREVVVVGGEPRGDAASQLEEAFGCRVRWLQSAPHTSPSVFEPAITEEVAVVLLLIRWSSHVFGELVHVCKARGVPLVRLAGGYSPNRVAHDVLGQAEARLREAAA